MTMLGELRRLARAHSRVEFGLLELWLARERAWGLALRQGLG